MAAKIIYKLLTRTEWEAARAEGLYCGSAHDLRDGFIHFSTAAQLQETARKYFVGVADLVLLEVDVETLIKLTPHPAALRPPSPARGGGALPVTMESPLPIRIRLRMRALSGSSSPRRAGWERGRGEGEQNTALRWEPARGGDFFPHLYGPLPISAVKIVTAIPLGEDGIPIIPCDLKP